MNGKAWSLDAASSVSAGSAGFHNPLSSGCQTHVDLICFDDFVKLYTYRLIGSYRWLYYPIYYSYSNFLLNCHELSPGSAIVEFLPTRGSESEI